MQKNEALGKRVRLYNNTLFVEHSDLKGLNIGEKFTLREIGNVYIDSFEKDGEKIKTVTVTSHPEDRELKTT